MLPWSLFNVLQCSWVLMRLTMWLCHANAHECLWLHMITKEYSRALISAHACSQCHGVRLMCVHDCSRAFKQTWTLMSPKKTHEHPRAFMSMVLWHHEHSWVLIPSRHHAHQCFLVIRSAQEYSWLLLSDPEWSRAWFSN